MSRHTAVRRAHARPSAARRRAPVIGLLVTLTSLPTLVAVVAGSAWLDQSPPAREPFVSAAPHQPVVVGPGDMAPPNGVPVERQPGAAEPPRPRGGGGAGRSDAGRPESSGAGGGQPESCDGKGTGQSGSPQPTGTPTSPPPTGPPPSGPPPSGSPPGPTSPAPTPSPTPGPSNPPVSS